MTIHSTALATLVLTSWTALVLTACFSQSNNGSEPVPTKTDAPKAGESSVPAQRALDSKGRDAAPIFTGLVKVDSLDQLPQGHSTQSYHGYPGSQWHWGAFTDEAQYKAFAAKAFGDKGKAVEIDWTNEAVALLILDAKTNALSFERWDGSDGTLHFVWSGIEPAYADATPGLIIRIPKRSVTFKEKSGQATFKVDMP